MSDIYGTQELADAAGIQPRTLSAYLVRGGCPAPDVVLACGPVWREATVREWLRGREQRALEALEKDIVFDRVNKESIPSAEQADIDAHRNDKEWMT